MYMSADEHVVYGRKYYALKRKCEEVQQVSVAVIIVPKCLYTRLAE